VEELMQKRNYLQNIYLAERICGICSGVHSITYTYAVERLVNMEIPERAKYIRTIIGELERIHSHLLFLGVIAYEMGLDTLFMYTWKDRELVMEILEEITGNRVNYAMMTPGGVRRDIPDRLIPSILDRLRKIEERSLYYEKVFSKDKLVEKRTSGIGILPHSLAHELSIRGPHARASGIGYDIRRVDPYASYDKIEFEVVTLKDGDVRARILVRAMELFQSVRILKACLKELRSMRDKKLKNPFPLVVPESEAIARCEAPRGEVLYYIVSNGTDKPERVKVTTPSFANMVSMRPILMDQHLADLPVIVASTDPCFSCTDRITLIDGKSGKSKIVNLDYIRRKGRA